jgi:putative transposase
LVKETLEAFLELEMEEHLGYPKHDPEGRGSGNSRNGKTVRGDFGEVEIETPRDRNSSFEPKIVAKRQTSVGNFSEAVISLYARGLTTREIEQHVKEIYGIEISPQFVSRVTEELQQQIVEWQSRPLERLYPIVLSTACAWRCARRRTVVRRHSSYFHIPSLARRIDLFSSSAAPKHDLSRTHSPRAKRPGKHPSQKSAKNLLPIPQ